jgi:hypothetical protein
MGAEGEIKVIITAQSNVPKVAQDSAEAINDLNKEVGVINVSQADIAAATEKTTEKFAESRREIRQVGNELGRLTGISGLGGLALGGVAAAAFGAAKALEFLKSTWETIQEAIKGPIEIGIPPDAPAHISAAATAWNEYATARAKVIAAQNSPESLAGQREKELANELKLIKEVMDAEKQKALADLEQKKDTMTPEAYAAARDNIENIFAEAGKKAEEKNRLQGVENKSDEAFGLEMDAREKTKAALAIKAAPENVAASNQRTLDENAANGEKALIEINANIEMIKRLKAAWSGGDVAEYEGLGGKFQQIGDAVEFSRKYGYGAKYHIDEPLQREETRKAQAEAEIDVAATYRKRQADNSTERKRLMDEAGTESGRAGGLRGDAARDFQFNKQQSAVDAHVAGLHQEAADKIAGASGQTTVAVKKVLDTTLGGFRDIHAVLADHDRQLSNLQMQQRYMGTNINAGH